MASTTTQYQPQTRVPVTTVCAALAAPVLRVTWWSISLCSHLRKVGCGLPSPQAPEATASAEPLCVMMHKSQVVLGEAPSHPLTSPAMSSGIFALHPPSHPIGTKYLLLLLPLSYFLSLPSSVLHFRLYQNNRERLLESSF